VQRNKKISKIIMVIMMKMMIMMTIIIMVAKKMVDQNQRKRKRATDLREENRIKQTLIKRIHQIIQEAEKAVEKEENNQIMCQWK
jgi:hypothetical protein